MTIREAKLEDMEQINKLAEKYDLSVPKEGKLIVAESDGVIKAFSNIRYTLMIEPFISENPLIGKKLWDYMDSRFSENVPLVRCFTKEKNVKLFEKLGFNQVFESEQVLEKNYREV